MNLVVNDVIDKEVDKEMTKVVEEVNKKLVNKRFSCSTLEEFGGPHVHYKLKKGFLHVNYVLKRFLVETT